MADENRTLDSSEKSDSLPEEQSAEHEADTPTEVENPLAGEEQEDSPADEENSPSAAESTDEQESPLDGEATDEQPEEPQSESNEEEPAEGEIDNDELGDDEEEPAEGEIDNDELDEEEPEDNKEWYVVKVQSGREDTIKNAIERRVKIDGLEEFFGRILVPVEKVTEMRNNKRVVRKKKLYPGYLMVNVEYNDKILYLFRETSGVGDFVGGSLNKPPQPMPDTEIEYILNKMNEVEPTTTGKTPTVSPSKYSKGDKVRVKDGTFVGMEGEVMEVLETKGAVKVELSIFDRPVPVELEYWQVDFTE